MMDKDKKIQQTENAESIQEPATTRTSDADLSDAAGQDNDADTGDYVVVGSGLGIDE